MPATLGGPSRSGPVVAIGNPLGLAASASAGVVSGLDRRADTADGTFAGLIQFDAAVNGSSGAALDAGGRRRDRRLDRRPGQGQGLRRHRLRGPDRHGPRRGRAGPTDLTGPHHHSRSRHDRPHGATRRPGVNPFEEVLFEVKRTIVGQDNLLERMAVALLTGGHLLVEGVPGLAKTLAVRTLAAAIGGQFQRIQFTPDLVPADLTGGRVYRQNTGEFETTRGPVFTNLLLADEINRAPAKVQSALLEVMQERQVTIGRETLPVPTPFLVLATQNPIESEGTYPLPEAQVDRFMMKVVVGYPSAAEEHAIVQRSIEPAPEHVPMLTLEDLAAMQAKVRGTYVDPAIVDYSVRLVTATRSPAAVGLGDLDRYVTYGASPRASIALVAGARALAFLRGRDYVLPPDLGDLALDVLRHRLVLLRGPGRRRRPRHGRHPSPELRAGPARGAAGSVTVVTAPDRLLHHLEWHVLRRLEGRLNGAYRTNQRGAGVDLAGLREYVDTDDARRIDWSATARTGETLVREYNEDRDLGLARPRPLRVHGRGRRGPHERPTS